MNPTNLPFDADAMLAGLRPWIECESPTYDAAAVNRMMDLAARDLALMGARIERIPGRMGFGDCVRARFPHPKEDEPGILVMGHMDTVHPVGTLAALPFRRDGERCYGPGDLRHEGRQLRRARGDPSARPGRHRDAAAGDRAVHPRRGGRNAEHARPRRGRGGAPPLRAGARARDLRRAASSPAATPSRASTSRPSAGRATPARGLPRGARRSAPWPAGSSRSRP